jgi:hypothetical protein
MVIGSKKAAVQIFRCTEFLTFCSSPAAALVQLAAADSLISGIKLDMDIWA